MTLHLSKVVSSLIGGDISDRIGRKAVIITGWLIYALVYAGFAFVSSAWQCWALFIIYGTYFGLTEGVEKAFVSGYGAREESRNRVWPLQPGVRHHGLSGLAAVWPGVERISGRRPHFLASAGVSLAAMVLLTDG